MYRQTRWVVTGLLYMWICESHAARAENRQEQMTLVVCDRVHLDPLVLDTARDGVTREELHRLAWPLPAASCGSGLNECAKPWKQGITWKSLRPCNSSSSNRAPTAGR